MKALVEDEVRTGCRYSAEGIGFMGIQSPEPWSKNITETLLLAKGSGYSH